MEDHFNSYFVLIDKLKNNHKIDLLNDASGVDTVLAHLTFKKFPQNVKNVLMQICDSHYPTFQKLIDKLPTAIERISKSKCTGVDEVICSNVTAKNYKPKNVKDKKPYCSLCDKEYHYSSECIKYSTIHDRINRLKELKKVFLL